MRSTQCANIERKEKKEASNTCVCECTLHGTQHRRLTAYGCICVAWSLATMLCCVYMYIHVFYIRSLLLSFKCATVIYVNATIQQISITQTTDSLRENQFLFLDPFSCFYFVRIFFYLLIRN